MEQCVQRFPGTLLLFLIDDGIGIAQAAPEAGIRLAGCKIEVAQQSGSRCSTFDFRQQLVQKAVPRSPRITSLSEIQTRNSSPSIIHDHPV
jgi:hypothetical protein